MRDETTRRPVEVDASGPTAVAVPPESGSSSAAMAAQFRVLREEIIDPATETPSATARYVFGEVFARGGLGQVRRAFDRHLGRTVAVKETLAPRNAERFVREAQVTARLDHPAVVPVHDIGHHPDGRPYYCMKLIEGRSLEAAIADAHDLTERVALLQHVITVAEVIAFAHERRVLHRDLKPANILVGKYGETWVIDWGLTAYVERDEAEVGEKTESDWDRARLTRTGEWMGTLPYMAPEQLGDHEVDERVDVYGLGAVLYHTLAGRRPYMEVDGQQLLTAVALGPPTDLGLLVPDVPTELQAIVRKAMTHDPDQRYPSARALADDLRRFQTGRLVEAHRYRVSDMLARWARRHRAALSVAGFAAALLAGAGMYGVRMLAVERDTALQNERRAIQHEAAAESARAEADRRTVEARGALATMLEQEGRRELIERRRPIDAQEPLRRAVELAPERSHVRRMLAQATRPERALQCEGQSGLGADAVVLAPGQPLAALASPFRPNIELWDVEKCERQDVIALRGPIRSLEFSNEGEALWALTSHHRDLVLARYDLAAGAVVEQRSLPTEYADGRIGASGAYASFVRRRTWTPASTALFLTDVTRAQVDVPAWRHEVSPAGATLAWLDEMGVHVHEARKGSSILQPNKGVRALLAVGDAGETLIDGEGRLQVVHADGQPVTLEPCGAVSLDEYGRSGQFYEPERLVIAANRGRELSVWHTDTGACVGTTGGVGPRKVQLARRFGELYLVTEDADAHFSVWRVRRSAGLDRLMAIDAHEDGLFDLDVRELDGSIATIGRGGGLKVWDMDQLVGPPTLHAPRIALHPSGESMAVADADSVYLAETRRASAHLRQWNLTDLDSLRWDGDTTLVARRGTHLFHWDVGTAEPPVEIDVGHMFLPEGLSHDPIDGTSLVVVSGALVGRTDALGPTYDVRVLRGQEVVAQGFPMDHSRRHPARSWVGSGGSRALISDTGILLDVESGMVVATLSGSAIFGSDTDIFDLAPRLGLVLYSANTGELLDRFDSNAQHPQRGYGGRGVLDDLPRGNREVGRNRAAAVKSPANDRLVSLGNGPAVTLWSYPELNQIRTLEGHDLPVARVQWSHDGARLVTFGGDVRACIWDPESGALVAKLDGVKPGAIAVMSPDAALLAIQDAPSRLTVVDLQTGRVLFAVAVMSPVEAAFTADARSLVVVEAPPESQMLLRLFEIEQVTPQSAGGP